MANYIELVLVKHQKCPKYFLFQAPRWSHLEPGTEVTCETKHGIATGEVVKSCTVEPNSEEYEMIKLACEADDEIKKILGVIQVKELDYSDD